MLVLVGAGFLGSIFAEEAGKRLWAQDMILDWKVIDDDQFETRNAANQNVRVSQFGPGKVHEKSHLAADTLGSYQQGTVEAVVARVDADNINSLIPPDECELIIDAVDNLAARHLLWGHGIAHGIPVMHMGLSQGGTGVVEWTFGMGRDSFSMSPINMMNRPEPPAPKTLKPCELIAHRATGFLIAHRGAVALGHLMGLDPEGEFPDLKGQSFATTWQVSDLGVKLLDTFEL